MDACAHVHRSLQSAKTRFEGLGLDPRTLERAASIARTGVARGALGRDEFMKLATGNGISTEGQRGYHIIFYLSQLSLVC